MNYRANRAEEIGIPEIEVFSDWESLGYEDLRLGDRIQAVDLEGNVSTVWNDNYDKAQI